MGDITVQPQFCISLGDDEWSTCIGALEPVTVYQMAEVFSRFFYRICQTLPGDPDQHLSDAAAAARLGLDEERRNEGGSISVE